ncbi:MAG: neutral zinc metallopeptidase [Propionibacteriaceae bacterium]|nr:neutral zinc metallopeptidase [Propionibacteriaceae bacterium]
MQYNPGAQLDPSQMGGGGRGRGGTVAVGGGASIIIVILALLFGFDPGALLGGGSPAPQQQDPAANPYRHCLEGADIQEDPECRWVAYQTSIQNYWKQALPGYEPARTNIFDGAVNTACGQASSDLGPFYCPADQAVYFDTSFFQQMLPQLGAEGGDAAEAYVIAHEYGHHISNLTGIMEQVQRQGQTSGPNSPAVRLELQADCYAGVWLNYASSDADNIISEVTEDDLDRAVNAAEVVGDDHIQRMQAGRINPDQWTHGSSQMRKQWLAQGFNSGDPNQCNTFAAGAIN